MYHKTSLTSQSQRNKHDVKNIMHSSFPTYRIHQTAYNSRLGAYNYPKFKQCKRHAFSNHRMLGKVLQIKSKQVFNGPVSIDTQNQGQKTTGM